MSSDNGVYILHTLDGWRVIHAQAIDNLYWWRVEGALIDQLELRNEINPSSLFSYFKDCEIFKEKYEAWHKAVLLYREIGDVEYGIQFIEGFENKEFPKKCCDNPNIIVNVFETKRCFNCGEYL